MLTFKLDGREREVPMVDDDPLISLGCVVSCVVLRDAKSGVIDVGRGLVATGMAGLCGR